MASLSTRSVSGETPLRPKLPLKLGRYTLCEELGAGGMATVYLARMDLAAGLDRLVALKTIHPHLAREKAFVDMFLDEARIASHVSHPNVCSVHDFGELGGVYYLAMEYLLGEPLFDVINRLVERFEEVQDVLPFVAARVIADACEGIHAAHVARGPDGTHLHIVHRDVSPQNLFITYDGSVKVVDFGCAKASQRVAHTSTGVMKGKVGYAAPEQLRQGDVDARADVWALGVCLWEALTLSPLFTKDTAMKTAMSVLEDPIEPAASSSRPWIPEEVSRIAAKALRRDPDERYASAREMGRDLRKFIADSGFTLESAELAEWMGFLFEDRHEERVQQAARARELDVSEALEALPEMLDVGAADVVELLPDAISTMEAIALHEQESSEGSTPPPLPVREPRKKTRRWPLVLLALVLLGVGGLYLHRHYELAPWALELLGLEKAGTRTEGDEPPETSEPASASPEPVEPAGAEDGPAATVAEEEAGAAAESEKESERETPSNAEAAAEMEPSNEPRNAPARRRSGSGGPSSVTTVISGSPASVYAPTEPSAPAPVEPKNSATLTLVPTSGWADVYLGSRRLGRTPLRTELPAGHHRLRILPYGQEPASELPVDIEAEIDQRLTIELPPPPAEGE